MAYPTPTYDTITVNSPNPAIEFQSSASGSVARSYKSKLGDVVNLADFAGYDPTGATDSTAALAAASASLGTQGGVIEWTGTLLINSAFTLPDGVSLSGKGFNPGFQVSEIYNGSYFPSIVVINPSNSIVMGSRSAVSNALVMTTTIAPKGTYPLPFGGNASSAVSAFSGTAFTPKSGAADNRLENLLIIGFAYAYDARSASTNARPVFRHVLGDCTNGIFASNVTDDGFGENCKFWPFTTVIEGQSTPALLLRSGTAFYVDGISQGMTWDNCGSYGYAIGHDINGIRNIRHINCAVDSSGSSNSIGFQYRGAINNCINIGAEIAGMGSAGVVVNTTGDGYSTSINLIGTNFHGGNSANGYINVLGGHITATGCHFDSNDPHGHVNLQSASTLLTMSDCTHTGYGSAGSPIIGNATAIANAQIVNAKNIAVLGNPLSNQLSATTFTGTANVKVASGSAVVGADAPAGNFRISRFRSAGSDRWWVGADTAAEGGSNSGSNFGIWRYSDTGTFIDEPISINRATGVVSFSQPNPSISYKSGATGATTRTLSAKLGDVVSVMDFGAKGDGTTDDSAAFQAAVNASDRVKVPSATYLVNTAPIWGTKSVHWEIDPAALISGNSTFPRMATNGGIPAVGPYIKSQSTTVSPAGDATAAFAVESIPASSLNGGVIGIFAGTSLTASGSAAIASAANFVATAQAGSNGNIWGLEIDVGMYAATGTGTQFGLSLNGDGSGNPTFAIKADRADSSKWQYGVDLRNCITGLYVENTSGLTNGIIVGQIPTHYSNMSIMAGQLANGGDNLFLQRFTDTSPTGYLINAVNAANSAQLFSVDVLGNLFATTLLGHTLTVSQAAASTPSGTLQIGAQTATTASAGSAALPSAPTGFIIAYLGSTEIKLPYYGA